MICDVKCDTTGCNFLVKYVDPYLYHNAVCPDCNLCVLINDDEVKLLKSVDRLQKISNAFSKFVRFFGFKPKMAVMSFDAGPARRGEKVDVKVTTYREEDVK